MSGKKTVTVWISTGNLEWNVKESLKRYELEDLQNGIDTGHKSLRMKTVWICSKIIMCFDY